MKSFMILAVVVLAASFRSGIAQSSAPPSASFGGPVETLPSSVLPPAGNVLKVNWRAVGTQNYSSGSDSQYQSAGAVANFFLQNATNVVGQHFFISNGAGGLSPVFTRSDATTGQELGRVVASMVASNPTPAANDDGGYGSVPTLLLQAQSATGFFAGVTYVTRGNVSGGVVPGNPKLFTLPASPTGVADALLAVPYQADYHFFVPGGASSG